MPNHTSETLQPTFLTTAYGYAHFSSSLPTLDGITFSSFLEGLMKNNISLLIKNRYPILSIEEILGTLFFSVPDI